MAEKESFQMTLPASEIDAALLVAKNGVSYEPQTIPPEKQAQARANMGALARSDLFEESASPNLFNKDAEGVVRDAFINTGNGAEVSYVGRFCSDYIPVDIGETYAFLTDYSFAAASSLKLACYSVDKIYIGVLQVNEIDTSDDTAYKVRVVVEQSAFKREYASGIVHTVDDVAFVRATHSLAEINSYMFVVGSEYPDKYIPFGSTESLADNITQAGNPLYAKTIIWDGDSICAGKAFDDADGAWAGRIAERNSMTYKNYAVGGGTITENVVDGSGNTKHSVSANLDTMYAEYPDADYIILEGGTNDADILGDRRNNVAVARFGTFTEADFNGNYDADTFCGALENIFFRATNYWKGKKIGFIVAQKMGRSTIGYTAETHNRRNYFETAMAICEKWGIPVLNLWDDCYLNPTLPHHYTNGATWEANKAAGNLYADGQHLLSAGYDYTADIVNSWLKTL